MTKKRTYGITNLLLKIEFRAVLNAQGVSSAQCLLY